MKTTLTTYREVARALASGDSVFAEWIDSENCQFTTSHGVVRECRGGRVLVEHWSKTWIAIGDPHVRIFTSPSPQKPTFHEWLADRGIEWPNLGVNLPAGYGWGAANFIARLHRQYTNENL